MCVCGLCGMWKREKGKNSDRGNVEDGGRVRRPKAGQNTEFFDRTPAWQVGQQESAEVPTRSRRVCLSRRRLQRSFPSVAATRSFVKIRTILAEPCDQPSRETALSIHRDRRVPRIFRDSPRIGRYLSDGVFGHGSRRPLGRTTKNSVPPRTAARPQDGFGNRSTRRRSPACVSFPLS